MSFRPRIPLTFESDDGNTVATFGPADFEWSSDQPLLVPSTPLLSANYDYDLLGNLPALKAPARESISFILIEDDPSDVDDQGDDLLDKCWRIGRGKLWAEDRNGNRRWAYARAVSMPSTRFQASSLLEIAVSIEFRRNSDWYAEEATDVEFILDDDPDTITLTNPGSNTIYNAVLLIRDFTDSIIVINDTNQYTFSIATGDDPGSSSDDVLRVDFGTGHVYRSYDAGVNWILVDEKLTRGTSQAQIMVLSPGANDFVVYDADGAQLNFSYYP